MLSDFRSLRIYYILHTSFNFRKNYEHYFFAFFLTIFYTQKTQKNPRNWRNFTICENVSFKYVYN